MRRKGTAQELERRRRRAVALIEQGHGIRETATLLAASPSSVADWIARYRAHGARALDAKPNRGRPVRLSARQQTQLARLLQQGPRRHGYRTELWTLARIAEMIARRFGVHYEPSGVWRLLRRMGLSAQKPARAAREADPQAIVRFRIHDWPRLKKTRPA